MKRWPSITYLVYRESRESLDKQRLEKQEARQKLVAHCQTCGCLACQVRLAVLGEFFVVETIEVERENLKYLVN